MAIMQLSPALLGLATLTLVFAQFPQPAPAPLPPVTPSDVVNILIQALSDSPGDVVASVVAAVCVPVTQTQAKLTNLQNDTATVYALECAIEPTRSANPSELRCLVGRARWSNGVTITQGPSSMIWSYSGPENSGVKYVSLLYLSHHTKLISVKPSDRSMYIQWHNSKNSHMHQFPRLWHVFHAG